MTLPSILGCNVLAVVMTIFSKKKFFYGYFPIIGRPRGPASFDRIELDPNLSIFEQFKVKSWKNAKSLIFTSKMTIGPQKSPKTSQKDLKLPPKVIEPIFSHSGRWPKSFGHFKKKIPNLQKNTVFFIISQKMLDISLIFMQNHNFFDLPGKI